MMDRQETRKLEDLTPYDRNPRQNDGRAVDEVLESLKRHGQVKPIVVSAKGHPFEQEIICCGHTTLKALQKFGAKECAVVVHEFKDEAEFVDYNVRDNQSATFSMWDNSKLVELSQNFDLDLQGMGFDMASITGEDDKEITEDEVPEPPPEPITKPGDLWLLGDHRLLCGDSTKAEDIASLLNGQSPALLLADPPYFMKVDADWDNDFDGYDGFLAFLDVVFGLWIPKMIDRGTSGWWCAPDFAWHIEDRLRKHAAVFNHIVWSKGKCLGTTVSVEEMRRWRPRSERLLLCEKKHSPDALLASFNAKTAHIAARSAYASIIDRMIAWQKQAGLKNIEIDKCLGTNGMAGHYFGRSQWALPTQEAWDKMRPLFKSRGVDIGEFDAQRQEFDAQRQEFDAQRQEFDAQRREFDAETSDNLTDVWDMSAPHGDDRHGHPTPKPVALISKLVSAHSRADDLVADPFLGSGTTLIAAEQLGRKCYGMEISPEYCDVIVKRWETLTGKKATRA